MLDKIRYCGGSLGGSPLGFVGIALAVSSSSSASLAFSAALVLLFASFMTRRSSPEASGLLGTGGGSEMGLGFELTVGGVDGSAGSGGAVSSVSVYSVVMG